jgi:hypothetical protein
MQIEDPPQSLNQKEKTQWSTTWARLLETEVSIKPIVPQNLYDIPNNRVMFMEQIFQDINKSMLETTYNLRLGQLLKRTLDLKKYMWHKLSQKTQYNY